MDDFSAKVYPVQPTQQPHSYRTKEVSIVNNEITRAINSTGSNHTKIHLHIHVSMYSSAELQNTMYYKCLLQHTGTNYTIHT